MILIILTAIILLSLYATIASANPEGGEVIGGKALISTEPNSLVITQESQRVLIDWKSFDIHVNKTTQFKHPTQDAIILNSVKSDFASLIDGSLTANSNVIIVNPDSVIFGSTSQMDVGGLIASSPNILNDDFMRAGSLKFNLSSHANASIIKEGKITTIESESLGFVPPHVKNTESIKYKPSKVTLSSDDRFTLDMNGDKLIELEVTDQLESQSLRMSAFSKDDGGIIELSTKKARGAIDSVIDVTSKIRANSIVEENGKIIFLGRNDATPNQGYERYIKQLVHDELIISSEINASSDHSVGRRIIAIARETLLTDNAILNADGLLAGSGIYIGGAFQGAQTLPSGMYSYIDEDTKVTASSAQVDGGKVIVWGNEKTIFAGNIRARGDAKGKGGLIETSGKQLNIYGTADTKGGLSPGEWLLDPNDITITRATLNMSAGPSFTSTADSATLNLASITAALDSGIDVRVSTAIVGANTQLSNIIIASDIITTSDGASSLGGIINFSRTDAGTELVIKTLSGNIIFGGSADPTTGYIVGTTTGGGLNCKGIRLVNSKLSAEGRDITLNGKVYGDGGNIRYGKAMSTISLKTEECDTITLNGKGGDNISNNYGVNAAYDSISSLDGDITITRIRGGGTGNDNYGVTYFLNPIQASGTDSIILTGSREAIDTATNTGISSSASTVSVQDADLKITAIGGNSAFTAGLNYSVKFSSGAISFGGSELITINAASGTGATNNNGVIINSLTITNSAGNISITGTIRGNNTTADGINISNTSIISSTGFATITLDGTAATGYGIMTYIGTNNIGDATTIGNINLTACNTNLADLTIISVGNIRGTQDILLRATNNIRIGNNVAITAATDKLNITLCTDSDASRAGAIEILGAVVDRESVLISLGGNITLGGGLDPTIDYTIGAVTNIYGVKLSYAQLFTGDGDIIINCKGLTATAANQGSYVYNASTISTIGTGTITLNASSAAERNIYDDIRIDGSTVLDINGNAIFTGGVAISSVNGVRLRNGAASTSTGSGAPTITGTTTNAVSIKTDTGSNIISNVSDIGYISLIADILDLSMLTLNITGNIYIAQKTKSATMDVATTVVSHIKSASIFNEMTSSSELYLGNLNIDALKVSSAYNYIRSEIFDTSKVTITVSASQSTVAANKGSFEFIDPLVHTTNLNISSSSVIYDHIEFNSNLTTNTDTIHLRNVIANNNILAYPSIGLLNLGGILTSNLDPSFSRNIILHENFAIDNGTKAIIIFDLKGTGDYLDLSATFNSVSGRLDLKKNINIISPTKFNMSRGSYTTNEKIISNNDLEFLGTGKLYLGDDITPTCTKLTFDISTSLKDAIEIDTSSGNILFNNTLDNDQNIIFKTLNDLTFKENVGYQNTLGYFTTYNAKVKIQKGFRSRGLKVIQGKDFTASFDPGASLNQYFNYNGSGDIEGKIFIANDNNSSNLDYMNINTSGYLKVFRA
jgi:filamentous hemagglutinin family protein